VFPEVVPAVAADDTCAALDPVIPAKPDCDVLLVDAVAIADEVDAVLNNNGADVDAVDAEDKEKLGNAPDVPAELAPAEDVCPKVGIPVEAEEAAIVDCVAALDGPSKENGAPVEEADDPNPPDNEGICKDAAVAAAPEPTLPNPNED